MVATLSKSGSGYNVSNRLRSDHRAEEPTNNAGSKLDL